MATLPPTSSVSDLITIKEQAKSNFEALADEEPEDILIQVFDKEFEEWIDIDCSFVVEARQKFNIVVNSVQKPAKVKKHKEKCRVVSNYLLEVFF